jgi:HK97 family phage portal protein
VTILRGVIRGGEQRGRALGDGNDLQVLGARTPGAARIGDEKAMTIPAFYAGVTLIAELAGMVPLELRRRKDGVVSVDLESRLAPILSGQMNPEQSSGDVVEWSAASLLLDGNAYLWRLRTPDGRFNGYLPLNPARVQPLRVKKQKVFLVSQDLDAQDDIAGTTRDILHIRGVGMGGLRAWSPVTQVRDLLRRSDGEARYQQSMLEKGVRPSGVLLSKKSLSPEAEERLRKRWQAAFGGSHNAGATPVLEEDLTWQQLSLSAADAQFLQQRQFTRQEIAMILRLPAGTLLASEGGTNHYSSAAMDLQYLGQYSIAPRTNRIQRAIANDPEIPWQSAAGPGATLFPYFNLDALSEADPTNRFRNYQLASWWSTQNEIRAYEGRGPIKGGDTLPPREVVKTPAAPTSQEPPE